MYTKWAEVLCNYSLDIKRGHYVVIVGEIAARPLLEACYKVFLEKGAEVDLMIQDSNFNEIFINHAPESTLSKTPRMWHHLSKTADRYLRIGAPTNTRALSGVSLDRLSTSTKAYRPILDEILGRSEKGNFRWCRTQFPTTALAQEADMGTLEFEQFSFRSGFLDQKDPVLAWKKLHKQQEALLKHISKKKVLHFENAQGTDVKVNIEGMLWENCSGKCNFPDGEIFSGPNLKAKDGGVNGKVVYSFPTIYKDIEVDGIEIEFKKGASVRATASKNEAFLNTMLSVDPGAKFVGEIALGTNYAIQRGTKSILYDEKIGGTFHMALGKGYPETGNKNQSALHWDLVCDMRKKATIRADGELIFENGRYLKDSWPGN